MLRARAKPTLEIVTIMLTLSARGLKDSRKWNSFCVSWSVVLVATAVSVSFESLGAKSSPSENISSATHLVLLWQAAQGAGVVAKWYTAL